MILQQLLGVTLCGAASAVFLTLGFNDRIFWRYCTTFVERNFKMTLGRPRWFYGTTEESYARRVRIQWAIGGCVLAVISVAWAVKLLLYVLGVIDRW